jgi:hypothetical protein
MLDKQIAENKLAVDKLESDRTKLTKPTALTQQTTDNNPLKRK